MKYREKLIALIFENDDEDAVIDWLCAQPDLDQPDILRDFKALSEEIAAKIGCDIHEMFDNFDQFVAGIDIYQEAILDEKLAEANLIMAQEEVDRAVRKMDEEVGGIREFVMECIINHEEHAEIMKILAEKLMQNEKDNNRFDPLNWIRIL